jgi:DNA-binding CsgD family transcriptional regulator
MGAVKHDISEGHRVLAERYCLDSPEGVHGILRDYHELKARRFTGDYAACDVLIDLHRAIAQAGLTPRQRKALRLCYIQAMTQEEAAEAMGVSQQAVTALLGGTAIKRGALERIADVFRRWEYGEVIVPLDD